MWTKAKILELLETNDKAVIRAVLAINRNQTADEQSHGDVKYRNGKGFRPCHARVGTSMAEFYNRSGYLTTKQISYWRTRDRNGNMRIGIYANQLLKEIKQ